MRHIVIRLLAAALFAVVAVVNWGSGFGFLYVAAAVAFGVSGVVAWIKSGLRH